MNLDPYTSLRIIEHQLRATIISIVCGLAGREVDEQTVPSVYYHLLFERVRSVKCHFRKMTVQGRANCVVLSVVLVR